MDSAPRNESNIRMVNQAGQQQNSPSYARQGASSQQQYPSSYSDRRPNQNYGQTPGGPTNHRGASNDHNHGYDSTPRNPTTNPRASGEYEQDYNPTSRGLAIDPRASSDYNPGYDPTSRGYPRASNDHNQVYNPTSRGLATDPRVSGDSSQGYNAASGSPTTNPRSSGGFNDIDEDKARKRASIPRKQIGTSGYAPTSSPVAANYPGQSMNQPPPKVPKHNEYSTQKPPYNEPNYLHKQRASAPASKYQDSQEYQDSSAIPPGLDFSGRGTYHDNNNHSRAPPLFPRAQNVPGSNVDKPAAKDIVQRAKTNTKDTEVIERIAPGKTQVP